MNLISLLESATKDIPDKTAIIEGQERVSFRDLWNHVGRLAGAYTALGIKEGDKIAVCLPNCKEYVYAFLGALKIKAVAVPLKQALTSYELKNILKDCRPGLFITDNQFLKKVLPFAPSLGTGKYIICARPVMRAAASRRIIDIDDVLRNGSPVRGTADADEGTIASINYTYRGYGYPLGAMLTHLNYRRGIELYLRGTGIEPGQRVLLSLPIYHIYPLIGSVLSPLFKGSPVVIIKHAGPKEVMELIFSGAVDVFASVPTFYATLLKMYAGMKERPPEVAHVFSGGSVLSVHLQQEVREKLGWNLRQGYGLTECLPVVFNPPMNSEPGSLGKAGEGVELKVVPESGAQGADRIGEILVKGDSVMAGYYNRPRETADVIRDGWCYTGDMGYFGKNGYLYFSGLKKRVAKVGGNMVDLEEVHRVIRSFTGVEDAVVDTIHDEIWGNLLTADVMVKGSEEFNPGELRSFLRKRLSSYKVPVMKIIV